MSFKPILHNGTEDIEDLIKKVTTKSGIYAWFYNFKTLEVYLNDLDYLKRQLIDISAKLKKPEFNTYLRSKFDSRFKGKVEDIGYVNEKIVDKKINNLSKNEAKILIEILQDFSPPLYIGISTNLRARYKEHIDSIQEKLCTMDLDKGKCFGHRVQKNDIKLEELIFKFYELDGIEKENIETLEYISNRFFKPIFGRR